jgi:protocatechuate 3,4-dioxygenase beta subunit
MLIAALVFAVGPVAANSETPSGETQKKAKLVDLWQPGDAGQRMNIRGRVTGLDGKPLAGIAVEIRQPDGDGNWTEQYRTTLTTDARGRYQFGSVRPAGRYCGEPHVEVTVYQDGWEFYDDKLVFDEVMTAESYYFGDGTQVFLEESTVNGETILFGRYDIVLSPE